MPRGCQHKRPEQSAAKWAARKLPKASHGKIKAKPTKITDERPSQRLVPKRVEIAPEWAKLRKSDHEKIPGTRIQSLRGGLAVRVVIEDGTKFPPHKALAAKRHLKKLAEKAKEKAEIARMLNSKEVVSVTGSVAPVDDIVEAQESEALPAPAGALPASRATAEQGSKKARKEAAWKERQQKLAEMHAAKVLEAGRELISQRWYEGEVVQRAPGKAWIKVSDSSEMPEQVLSKLRANSAEIGVEGELLSVCFADVLDKSLDMRPGVAVQFKVFTDKQGVGGCEAKPLSAKRTATQEPETDSGSKRAKTSTDLPEITPTEHGEATQPAETVLTP